MKRQKRARETKPVAAVAESAKSWAPPWWQWLIGFAGLFLVFEVYSPALNGAFVLDDLYLPFADPNVATHTFRDWLDPHRPLLMLSFWIDYIMSGIDPYRYHTTNVALHFLTSFAVMLVAGKLLVRAGVSGRAREVLAVFAGAVFLLHPLQTESVAYIASRSDTLSVLFFYGAFAVFLYRGEGSITLLRALSILLLFGAAIAVKEHTLMLPALFLLTDIFWKPSDLRKNLSLYVMLALLSAAGGLYVIKVLTTADTAGLHIQDLGPARYFFTECRVIWTYVRMFFLPFGQNVDPDIPISASILDHGAVFGFVALLAAGAGAWIYRKRYPLACFGVLMFLLLLAPTSSFIPIRDVLAERRMYLPFLGLILICLEVLRRVKLSHAVWIGTAALVMCALLTYQRSAVWATPLGLWQDTVAKSPNKMRPRFQLAFAFYQLGRCKEASDSYERAARLEVADYRLLVDWAHALDCMGDEDDAIEKLHLASALYLRPEAYVLLGAIYAKQKHFPEALDALAQAERLDPAIEQIYVNRGNIYAIQGDSAAAAREYRRALQVNPTSQYARAALDRMRL